jgi:hypothetical protein
MIGVNWPRYLLRTFPGTAILPDHGPGTSLSALPNIRLGITPLDTFGPDGALNTCTVYDERIATAETFGGVIMMRDPRYVSYHLQLFRFFERYAVFGDAVGLLLGLESRVIRSPD